MASKARRGREDVVVEPPAAIVGRRLAWLTAAAAWCFCLVALVSMDPADSPGWSVVTGEPGTSNWAGPAGAWLGHHLIAGFGLGAWIMLAAAGVALAHAAWRGPVAQWAVRGLGIVAIAVAAGAMHSLLLPNLSTRPEGGGGLVGIALADVLAQRFGTAGTLLWLIVLAAIGLTVAFDAWLIVVPRMIARAVAAGRGASAKGAKGVLSAAKARREERKERGPSRWFRRTPVADVPPSENEEGEGEQQEAEEEDLERYKPKPARKPKRGKPARKPAKVVEAVEESEEDAEWDEDEEAWEDEEQVDEEAEAAELSDEAIHEKISKLPVFFGQSERERATAEDLEALRAERLASDEADRNYQFPPLDLLEEPDEDFDTRLEAYVREQAEALEHALRQYRIDGEVVGIESGPVITLYQVRLAPGTKVAAIQSVDKDIARSLRAVNIRVVSNTEGLDTVGIEVPNLTKERVRLKELMTRSDAVAKMRLPMFLGKDASGRPLVMDLTKLPHALIAGTTGSGKSVCMNAIIMGFLYTQKPSDMKLVLVDPKMVEMSQFKDIPHLLCPVVTEMGKAAAILEWAVQKMDERYELLAEAGCRDISSYNKLGWDELKDIFKPETELQEARIPKKLPYIVFMIDELADLMMTNKEVEGSIVRIAQKARAVGIHLILATQRPQANVVTGLIKSNMPGRIAFKVASGMDSRIVLDQKGGELLLGQGDMLMITPRSSAAMRSQGTLVDDDEIRRVVKFVKEQGTATYSRELVAIKDHGFDSPGDPYSAEAHEERMRQSAQEDPLFDRAVEIVLETKRGSVSLLQRRLAIGYTRSSRLIEMMGFCGIIGQHKGSVAREVQMTLEQWEAIKARAGASEDDNAPLFEADEEEGVQPEASAATSTQDATSPHDDTEDVPFDVDDEVAAVEVHSRGSNERAEAEAKVVAPAVRDAEPSEPARASTAGRTVGKSSSEESAVADDDEDYEDYEDYEDDDEEWDEEDEGDDSDDDGDEDWEDDGSEEDEEDEEDDADGESDEESDDEDEEEWDEEEEGDDESEEDGDEEEWDEDGDEEDSDDEEEDEGEEDDEEWEYEYEYVEVDEDGGEVEDEGEETKPRP